jgi:hypothetical protein
MVLSPDKKALDLRKAAGIAPPEPVADEELAAAEAAEIDDVTDTAEVPVTADVTEQAAP